jgi:hypothetical protein
MLVLTVLVNPTSKVIVAARPERWPEPKSSNQFSGDYSIT